MDYLLVGYGKMGRAIDDIAQARGHRRQGTLDTRKATPPVADGPLVAFEFTDPRAARDNVLALLEAGIHVVCGTTGWQPDARVRQAAESGAVGAVLAPNLSVGVNLFYRAVRTASLTLLGSGLYEAYIVESHHRHKRDAPSGTALRLAEQVRDACPDVAPPPISSLRAGHEPGRHTVGFDGEFDTVELTHRARSRGGFALGAVLAAEWLIGRQGIHDFEPVLEGLLEQGNGHA